MNKEIIEKILGKSILDWSELGSGMCNTVYKITTDDNKYFCVKVAKQDAEVLESNSLSVEALITQELNNRNPTLPIPKVEHIDQGGNFYIYEFVSSKPLGEGDNDKYVNTLLESMGEFHSNINCVDKYSACGNIGVKEYLIDDFFYKYGGSFEGYAKNTNLPEEYRFVISTAFQIFQKTKDDVIHEQLLHNDIHGENIFLDENGKLDCVIDFGDAVWGDIHLDMMWYVHGYPNDWTRVVEAYEKSSGYIINKPKLISLACIRFTSGLCRWYLEGQELAHCDEKFKDYKNLMNKYITTV